MNDIEEILVCLEKSPLLLKNLVASIPRELLKKNRIPGKWNIHEHACHLVGVQPMFIERFRMFKQHQEPVFEVYIPGKTVQEDLMSMDLDDSLGRFEGYRDELIRQVKSMDKDLWQRHGRHDEYIEYTPYIMLRHILSHDHVHMYRIEELWLTRDEYLPKGIGGG